MKTIETKNSTLKNMNHRWSGKNDPRPCAWNTLSKTIWATVNMDQNWWKFVQCSWTRCYEPTSFFQQGKCVCINSVCVNYCVCRCVCERDYKADLAMIILAADHVSAWRGNMYRVQDWPQHLTKWRGEHFGGQICDIGGNFIASEKLGHLVSERVTVVFKQSVLVTTICCFSKWGQIIHKDLLCHLSVSQLHHCVRRSEHRPTL